jgi:hypothetical protein
LSALTVWGISLGTRRRIVATETRIAARLALGLSAYTFRNYVADTGNDDEIRIATARPGVVFSMSNQDRDKNLFKPEKRGKGTCYD